MLRPEHCSSCMTHPSWQTSHPSRDPTWPTSIRYTPLVAIQEDQYTTDPPETHRAAREAERTIWQGSQSQRSVSPEVERTSPILPKQASHGPHQVDDWNSGWDTRMWAILRDLRPQWQSLQKESSSFEAPVSWRYLLSRPPSEERWENTQGQFLSRPFQPGQISVFQQQGELHQQWWDELYGHLVHDVWWPWDTSSTSSVTVTDIFTP